MCIHGFLSKREKSKETFEKYIYSNLEYLGVRRKFCDVGVTIKSRTPTSV
jgi:hypothetical protein